MTTRTEREWILSLASDEAALDLVGGKAASLASLTAAGFPVPPGFTVTTAAYRRFVADNDLQTMIDEIAGNVDASDPAALELAAASIRELFARAVIAPDIASAIREAYTRLGGPAQAVAVRSSATAEDLPGLSFAGQQETFLDVRGETAVLDAVRQAWASLWSARAIGYRARMRVEQQQVAMAVVVQVMVPAESAGVLFTANPATGDRNELVINAAFGLGDALVSGTVTPDTYLVDRGTLETTGFTPGEPEAMSTPAAHWDQAILTDAQVRALSDLALRIERHFGGTPQDIEWAMVDGCLWILQSRPITTLQPAQLPDVRWESPIPGATWVRRQVVEHMPEPLSPLFAELYLDQGLGRSFSEVVRVTGYSERIDEFYPPPHFTTVNGYAYMRADIDFSVKGALLLIQSLVTGPLWLFRHGVAYWRDEGLPSYLETIAHWHVVDPATASDEELLCGVRELAWADALYWFAAAIAIGTAKISDWVFDRFLALAAPGQGLHSGLFLRGFPSRTLQAEAELDTIAARARESASLRAVIAATPAGQLLEALPDSTEGRELRQALQRYFARYGHQIYSLDFAEPTLGDAPLPVLLGLKARVQEPRKGALARQADIARERDRLAADTARSFDPLRRFLFRRLLHWAQRLAPNREEALFFVGAAWPELRRLALELGRRLTEAGSLSTADDVFFLDSRELEAAIAARAAGEDRSDLAHLARERRALREARTRLHPPAAVPPSAHLQIGSIDLSGSETQRRNPEGATILHGFPVSPGRVTAPASVILAPEAFASMEPDTILVCPTTTPAWTPLFAQARGLVTDIGGILAHGSIVAREYGIPAVMGTGNATLAITSGQEITVDGSAGTVALSR
jgi:pyruvate,water dikinase